MSQRSTATATILFTDVERSTELRVRLGEVASDRLFADHQRQLGGVVVACGGRLVKGAGDGVMASFESATMAVVAAVSLQQHVALEWPELRVRVGVASGDVTWEDGDCFGLPVVTAARLEAAASGGEILVSSVVRALAGDRAAASYEARGPVVLKGLPEPVEVLAVHWEPASPGRGADGAPPPLPPIAAQPSTHRFVGRVGELASIRAAFADTAPAGRIVLVGGEAGAGKTRLAVELARQVHRGGAAVLYGGCDSDLALPYQPWVQAVVQGLPTLAPVVDERGLTDELAHLVALAPEIERILPGLQRPTVADPDIERYRLFGAFGAFFALAAETWPTVVVLDDLHWAGAQTLALLRHLARTGLPSRLLVVATFRDTGDEITDPLAGCLADLRRVERVDRVRVGGLDPAAVERLVADVTGQELDDDLRRLAGAVAARSGGNAFFVGQLWDHLVETGIVHRSAGAWVVNRGPEAAWVPEGVVEVVAARLGHLSPEARQLAELLAIAGQRVELRVAAAASELPATQLDRHLSALIGAGLLAEGGGPPGAPNVRFVHALVRDTVESWISPIAGARLHLQVALALEAVHEADRRPVLAELARHFAGAIPLGPVDKAVHYGRRAAAQALRSAAYDEAMTHLETVLRVVAPRSRAHAETLVELGAVCVRHGQYARSREVCETAFRVAVALGDPEVAARAAIGFELATHMPGLPGGPAVELLREAIAMSGAGDGSLDARLSAALGRALAHAGRTAEGRATAERAVGRARADGDPETLAVALQALLVALDDPERLVALADELAELAERLGDPWSAAYASGNRFRALVMLGRLDEAASTLEHHAVTSMAGRFPAFVFMTHAYEVVLAMAAGDFVEAESAAERAQTVGAADHSPFDAGVYGLQMFAIRRAQGRLGEVAPVLRALSAGRDAPPLWRPGLAAIHVELGQLDEARAAFEALAPDRFGAVPRDSVWPACLMFLADACASLGDVERAAELYDELLAFQGRNLMVGMTICFGPADRPLGVLAELLGRSAAADRHFEVALALAERSGSPVWAAEVRFDWATVLQARGDVERAGALGRQAHQAAMMLGIGRLAARPVPGAPGADARTPSPVAPPPPDGLSEREVEVLALVAGGLANREIGRRLYISPNTAANHVRSILQKTGCVNRAEAAAYAVRRGLVPG